MLVKGNNAQAYEACAQIAVQTNLQTAMAGLVAMQAWTGRHALSRITPNTMILWGNLDITYRWPLQNELCQGIAAAKLHVFADCAHAVHLENPHLFNTTVIGFLISH